MKLHSNVSSGRYTALQKGIPPGGEFSLDLTGLEKSRIPNAIATPPESLKIFANLGKPEQLDSSEHVEQTRTTRKRTTPKETNVGNIEDATQLQKAKNT